jgi:hypothetical protein
MESTFSNNPIKLYHIDHAGETSTLYVFVGSVPPEVERDLRKITYQNVPANLMGKLKHIEKFYGKKWIKVLGLRVGNNHKGGGDPSIDAGVSVSIPMDELLDYLYAPSFGDYSIIDVLENDHGYHDRIENADIGSTVYLSKNGSPRIISGAEILAKAYKNNIEIVNVVFVDSSPNVMGGSGGGNDEDEDKDDDENELDIEQIESLLGTKALATRVEKKNKKTNMTRSGNNVVWIFDYAVYPVDKVSELKEKIYAATGIYPFQQHLWYESMIANSNIPIAYNVWIGQQILIPDLLKHLIKGSRELVDTVPVDMSLFHQKKSITIESYDDFRILNQYHRDDNVTTYYMIDIDSVIPTGALKEIEIIYYGCIKIFFPMLSTLNVFTRYIKASWQDFSNEYPLLVPDRTLLRNRFKREHELFLNINLDNTTVAKYISRNTLVSITSAIITITPIIEQKISVRNIFDKLILSPLVNYCKVNFVHMGRRHEIHKRHLTVTDNMATHMEKERLAVDSVMINVRLGVETQESIVIIILQSGIVYIKSKWREEYYFGFDEIYQTVKRISDPVFNDINNMSSIVFGASSLRLTPFVWANIKFSEIDMSLFWKQSITSRQFSVFEELLKAYEKAGILESIDSDYKEFTFKKGMFQFDPKRINKMVSLDNQFEYLTDAVIHQKWLTLFGRTRRFYATQRFSDLRMDIVGIKEEEFRYFSDIIKMLLYDFSHKIKTLPQEKVSSRGADKRDTVTSSKVFNELLERRQKKALNDLKEKDPELYNTKKLYGEETPYSKICQKPFQPVILDEKEIKFLPDEGKSRAVQYFNFTTHTNVFYYCPQKKYPWIKFLTHKHPKGYCIPCCKKTAPTEDKGTLREVIHNTCLKTHQYTEEKKTLTEGSRYITTYGKPIEAGRLSNLPEGGLVSILISKLKLQQKSSLKCGSMFQKMYYVVGVPQNHPNRQNVGLVYTIADALEMSIPELLAKLARIASRNRAQLKFTQLYSIAAESSTIVEEIESMSLDLDWNQIIKELVFLFMDINIFTLEDPGDSSLYMVAHSQTVERMFPTGYRTLVVIHNTKQETYYPIYELVSETYFKSGYVDTRLFPGNHTCIKKFSDIITQRYITMNKSSSINGKVVKTFFDLDILEEYLRSQSLWKITGIAINSKGLCYLVQLEGLRGDSIYMPIHESSWRGLPLDTVTILSLKVYPQYGKYNKIISFINAYDKWVAHLSKQMKLHDLTIYPLLRPSGVILYSGKIIGFDTEARLSFYCVGVPTGMNGTPQKSRILFYDPIRVNTLLLQKPGIGDDWRVQNEARVLRSVSLYRLFLTEVHYYVMKRKNTAMRIRIKTRISKTDFNKPFDDNFYIELTSGLGTVDKNLLIGIIKRHPKNKANILLGIDNTHFDFDDFLSDIKKMDHRDIHVRLKKELSSVVSISSSEDVKIKNIPNIIVPCTSAVGSPEHCRNNKLILSRRQFDQFTAHLAYILSSPVLRGGIFSSIDPSNTIDFFDFEERPGEIIY